jgi:hypothetical protein
VQSKEAQAGPVCQGELPSPLLWKPTPLGGKAQLITELRTEALAYIAQQTGRWTRLRISNFNVRDPEIRAVLENAATGEYLLGTFAVNRSLAPAVTFDRLAGTDLKKIDKEAFLGSGSLDVPLRREK